MQCAENGGLPKPNGDGIYTFSDVEILKGQDEYAYGDGDITAYNLAIAQYRQDSSKHPLAKNRENYLDGGSIQEAYEILTGLPSNENSGTIGVSSVSLDFDEIYNMIKDGKGAACLSDEDHAYSVVGTDKDGNLLLQESNQDESMDKNKRYTLIDNSDPPTYKASKENFDKYIMRNASF